MTGAHPDNGKSQIDDDLLNFKKEVLLKEYEMLRQQMEKHDTQITQLRGFFLAFLGVYFGIIIEFNNFNSIKQLVFFIPFLITLFFAFNEAPIQYWKDRAVNRFKYLECRIMDSLEKTNGSGCWKQEFLSIIGPNLRLIKEPKDEDEDWTKYYFYDLEWQCKIKKVFNRGFFSIFYLLLIVPFSILFLYYSEYYLNKVIVLFILFFVVFLAYLFFYPCKKIIKSSNKHGMSNENCVQTDVS